MSLWPSTVQKKIRDWINNGLRNEVLLYRGNKPPCSIKASDIVVLVRNYQEVRYMRNVLALLNIPSKYPSNRRSIFETIEAQEILWLLRAVLTPNHSGTLRSALASSILGLSIRYINNLNNDKVAWNATVSEFDRYRST